MIDGEVAVLPNPQDVEGGGHGAFAGRQDRSHGQELGFAPGPGVKQVLKGQQQGYHDCGQGRHTRPLVVIWSSLPGSYNLSSFCTKSSPVPNPGNLAVCSVLRGHRHLRSSRARLRRSQSDHRQVVYPPSGPGNRHCNRRPECGCGGVDTTDIVPDPSIWMAGSLVLSWFRSLDRCCTALPTLASQAAGRHGIVAGRGRPYGSARSG